MTKITADPKTGLMPLDGRVISFRIGKRSPGISNAIYSNNATVQIVYTDEAKHQSSSIKLMKNKRKGMTLKKWMRQNNITCSERSDPYGIIDYHLVEIAYNIVMVKDSLESVWGDYTDHSNKRRLASLQCRRDMIMKYLAFNQHASKQMIQYALLQSAAHPNALNAQHRKQYAYELIAKLGGKK